MIHVVSCDTTCVYSCCANQSHGTLLPCDWLSCSKLASNTFSFFNSLSGPEKLWVQGTSNPVLSFFFQWFGTCHYLCLIALDPVGYGRPPESFKWLPHACRVRSWFLETKSVVCPWKVSRHVMAANDTVQMHFAGHTTPFFNRCVHMNGGGARGAPSRYSSYSTKICPPPH